jgi:hypothetical protein
MLKNKQEGEVKIMKKFRTIIFMALAAVMCFGLATYACKETDTGTEQTIQDDQVKKSKEPTIAPIPEDEGTDSLDVVQFKGKIDSIDGEEAIVTPDEGEDIRSSGDAIRINIADYSKPLKVGDAVTIYYDGIIMESYPLQINVLGINNEMFEIEEPSNSDDSDEAVSFDNPEALDYQK